MLAAPQEHFDPTLPGLFAADPPPEFVPLLAAIAADVRPDTLRRQLDIMAEADLSDLLPHAFVPTLLIWGQLDARSPLSVAHQFEEAIADTRLEAIEGAGHLDGSLTTTGQTDLCCQVTEWFGPLTTPSESGRS